MVECHAALLEYQIGKCIIINLEANQQFKLKSNTMQNFNDQLSQTMFVSQSNILSALTSGGIKSLTVQLKGTSQPGAVLKLMV